MPKMREERKNSKKRVNALLSFMVVIALGGALVVTQFNLPKNNLEASKSVIKSEEKKSEPSTVNAKKDEGASSKSEGTDDKDQKEEADEVKSDEKDNQDVKEDINYTSDDKSNDSAEDKKDDETTKDETDTSVNDEKKDTDLDNLENNPFLPQLLNKDSKKNVVSSKKKTSKNLKASALITTDDYEFNPDTGNLLIKTTAGLTSFATDGNIDQTQVTSLSFGDSMTSIPDYSGSDNSYFYNTKIISIDLNNVTSIGRNTFRTCTKLQNINLSKVKSIGLYAFGECTMIESIDLSSATSISDQAFQNCSHLFDAKLSSSATYGLGAFVGCAFDLSEGYPQGTSRTNFAYPAQKPKIFFSLDNYSSLIYCGDNYNKPQYSLKSKTGADYGSLVSDSPEWFYPYYSLPTVTEKEDTIDIFKPGKYTITYTIPKSYYADNNSLTYTLTVKDPNASLDVTSGTFDKYNSNENNKDISVKLDKGKYDLTSITNGETVLTKGTDYSVSEDTYTFPISYLSTLENGDNVITFNMSGGTSPTLTINVQDSTPIDAGLDSSETIFDKTMGSDDYDDVLVKLNPGSYSLLSINDNDYSLVQDQDYTNKENDYTIKKEYFKNIDEGDHNFVFKMSGGTSPQFTVHIVKSKDINASVTPTSATFDKNKNSKNHKDIQVLLDPVVYQINGIKNGNYTLVKGKDYSVKENKPFVENSINKSLDLGNLKELSKSNYNKFSILDNKENIHSKEALKNKSNNLNKDVFNLGINKTSYTNDEMDDVLYLIRDDYLDTLKPGTHKLTFDVSSGVDPVFTINISDTTKKKDDKNNGKNDGKSDSDKKDTGNKSDGNKGGSSSSNGGSGKIKNINSGSKPVKTGDYANTTEAIMFILIGLGLLCYVAKRVNRRN